MLSPAVQEEAEGPGDQFFIDVARECFNIGNFSFHMASSVSSWPESSPRQAGIGTQACGLQARTLL